MKNKKIANRVLTGALALGLQFTTGCNMSLIDTKYGQNTALIMGDDSAVAFDIKDWKDYEGEQYQIRTSNGLILLTSSFDTDLLFGESNKYTVESIAKKAISEDGEIHNFSKDENHIFNYELIDTNWRYNKAILFNKNNAVVLNVNNWKDYEGEQLQIVTDDQLVILLSSYNSKLLYDKQSDIKAEEFAKMYVGDDGKVTELGKDIDSNSIINYNFVDLKFNFNKVIIFKDKKAVILPVSEWKDYEGEQLQIKIVDGPIILTAAYDSILLDDSKSETKANDIASSIVDEVIDLTEGKAYDNGIYNKTILDLVYGFGNGIISNDNSSASIPISEWKDYEGEQLQVVFPNGDIMLTSSMFLDMINDGTNSLNANTLSDYYSTSKVTHNAEGLTDSIVFNKQIMDFQLSYNYALHIENGNVTILPLARWKDYYNSNGQKSVDRRENPDGTYHTIITSKDDSPNCEQLQLELPDGTVLLTSAYDTILFKTNDIEKYAELFRGQEGVITNLNSVFGEPTASGWNFNLFDFNWKFNYGIYNNGVNSQIFELKKWMDFADGEQVQLYFSDGSGMVSSYYNVTLVYTTDESKLYILANAFIGQELGTSRILKH